MRARDSLVGFARRLHDDLRDGFRGHQMDSFFMVHAHLLSHGLDEVLRDAPHRCRLDLDSVCQQHGTRLRHKGLEWEGLRSICHGPSLGVRVGASPQNRPARQEHSPRLATALPRHPLRTSVHELCADALPSRTPWIRRHGPTGRRWPGSVPKQEKAQVSGV